MNQQKNKIIIFCLLIFSQLIFSQSLEKMFVNMPDVLNPTLSRQNRLELLEFYKIHQGDSITNRFGNQAHVLLLDTIQKRLLIKNTANSKFDMKVNVLKDTTGYIGVIKTISAPVSNSYIEFYDFKWNKLAMKFFLPKSTDWLDMQKVKSENIDTAWVRKNLELSFIELSFTNEPNTITASIQTLNFISEADRNVIKPFLSDKPIRYRLKGQSWLRE